MLLLKQKDQRAIELAYLGKSYEEIAKELETTPENVGAWFRKEGKLKIPFEDYSKKVAEARQKKLVDELAETDDNLMRITTYVIREYAKRLKGFRAITVDENGQPVVKDGKFEMIDVPAMQIDTNDFMKVFEIQRLLQGKPTEIKTQNMIFDQKKMDEDEAVLRDIFEATVENYEENEKRLQLETGEGKSPADEPDVQDKKR